MKRRNLQNAFFSSNPVCRGLIEKAILVGTGICGLGFSWKNFSIFPVSNISGGILILWAYWFHLKAHRVHKQAHEKSQKIETVVTSGIFSKIRHPLYVSIIFMNIGIAMAFGVLITFMLSLLTIPHWILTALKEEETLLQQFPDEYAGYKQRVRWRMIPGLF